MVNVKKVVSYVRISSDSQIDNTSIEEQSEKIDLYCKLHGIQLIRTFKDEGESGSKTDKRKGYNDMLEYIKDNDIDSIIVYKADRIHRSLKNLLIMIDDLEEIKVAFISVTEQFDTSNAQGMLFLQMIGSFAEFERKTINARTKSGRVATAKQGKYAGGNIAFGYKLVDKNSMELDIMQEEAEIVKTIFKLRVEGKSLQRIANELNENGLLKDKKEWSKQAISYILSNRIYIGEYKYNGKKENNEITYKVDRIISKQLWNKVHN